MLLLSSRDMLIFQKSMLLRVCFCYIVWQYKVIFLCRGFLVRKVLGRKWIQMNQSLTHCLFWRGWGGGGCNTSLFFGETVIIQWKQINQFISMLFTLPVHLLSLSSYYVSKTLPFPASSRLCHFCTITISSVFSTVYNDKTTLPSSPPLYP